MIFSNKNCFMFSFKSIVVAICKTFGRHPIGCNEIRQPFSCATRYTKTKYQSDGPMILSYSSSIDQSCGCTDWKQIFFKFFILIIKQCFYDPLDFISTKALF